MTEPFVEQALKKHEAHGTWVYRNFKFHIVVNETLHGPSHVKAKRRRLV